MHRDASLPRRPTGWRAPGPAPAGSRGRPELEATPDEDLCWLAGDWRLFQLRRGHRWSLDDLVTAAVAAEVAGELGATRGLDLGCGHAAVLLLLAWRLPEASFVGIEAQADRAARARRSIAYNGVEARAEVLTADFRDAWPSDRPATFPLITGTPPYFPRGTGHESEKAHAAPCRFEFRGGVEAYLEVGRAHLAPEGRLVLCSASLEQRRVDAAARAHGLHRTRRVDVVPRAGKAPLLQVDVFGATPAAFAAQECLVVRDRDLQWTPAFRALRAAFGMPTEPPSRR